MQQLRKRSAKEGEASFERAELAHEQEVVTFARLLYPRLAPTISPIFKQFALESEAEFLRVMEENNIPEALEVQELCLVKHNQLEL